MNSSHRVRVLYVEDNPDCSEMLRVMLGLSHIDLECAGSVAEALISAESEKFDLYLLDTGLPDGSGRNLCRELRSVDPEVPILIYSGDAYPEEIRMGIAAGADAYITKPHVDELLATIARLVTNSCTASLPSMAPPGVDQRRANSFAGSSVMTA